MSESSHSAYLHVHTRILLEILVFRYTCRAHTHTNACSRSTLHQFIGIPLKFTSVAPLWGSRTLPATPMPVLMRMSVRRVRTCALRFDEGHLCLGREQRRSQSRLKGRRCGEAHQREESHHLFIRHRSSHKLLYPQPCVLCALV